MASTFVLTIDRTGSTVEISNISKTHISEETDYNSTNFDFTSSENFIEYKVCVVDSIDATHDLGEKIVETNGSVNMGTTGTFDSVTPISCTINVEDLKINTKVNNTDGDYIVKVFCKNESGVWNS